MSEQRTALYLDAVARLRGVSDPAFDAIKVLREETEERDARRVEASGRVR